MELYLRNWYDKLLDELTRTKQLKIVSPFIKEQVVRKIQEEFDFKNFELITRFNLRDFASGVSSLNGVSFCVEKGAAVYGIKDLHSRIYLFDNRAAIITSANLTSGGLVNNYECGIYITDKSIIQNLHSYFNELKDFAGEPLSSNKCDEWQQEISQIEITNTTIPSFSDYGASQTYVDKEKGYYIKFLGRRNNRVPLNFNIKDVIDSALCHYACGFSENKKPRQVREGDIIYLARMTEEPNNYAIFGKAEAIEYNEKRDRASKAEIKERPWKKEYPIYLRLKNVIFVDGTMSDCVFLYDIINALDYESFPTTSQQYKDGRRNINPLKSLSQQPYVRLTTKAVEWLEPRFQESLKRVGQVEQSFIDSLPLT